MKSEFKNIRFTDGTNDIPHEIAHKDTFFNQAYRVAKTSYWNCIDDINEHNGVLVLNNSNAFDIIKIENVSDELMKIINEKTNSI